MDASLLKHFKEIPDPRVDRTKRYPLIELLFLVICATISGCGGWKAIKDFGELKLKWLKLYLPYAQGIPLDDTIARVMRLRYQNFPKLLYSVDASNINGNFRGYCCNQW